MKVASAHVKIQSDVSKDEWDIRNTLVSSRRNHCMYCGCQKEPVKPNKQRQTSSPIVLAIA